MLACIIIVSLAYTWLLWESNFLRVNLCQCLCESGSCSQWRLPDSAVTYDMKYELISQWHLDKIHFALFDQGNLNPLWVGDMLTSIKILTLNIGFSYLKALPR